MLNIHPYEIGFCRGHDLKLVSLWFWLFVEGGKEANLCEKDAGDALGDTEQRLPGVLLGLANRFSKIARICQDCSAMLCNGVQLRLLGKGFVSHGEAWAC